MSHSATLSTSVLHPGLHQLLHLGDLSPSELHIASYIAYTGRLEIPTSTDRATHRTVSTDAVSTEIPVLSDKSDSIAVSLLSHLTQSALVLHGCRTAKRV